MIFICFPVPHDAVWNVPCQILGCKYFLSVYELTIHFLVMFLEEVFDFDKFQLATFFSFMISAFYTIVKKFLFSQGCKAILQWILEALYI